MTVYDFPDSTGKNGNEIVLDDEISIDKKLRHRAHSGVCSWIIFKIASYLH